MTTDVETWLAAHPARGDGPVRAVSIPCTHSPEWVAVFAVMRDAAAIVGPQPDQKGVNTAWLDEAIRRAPE